MVPELLFVVEASIELPISAADSILCASAICDEESDNSPPEVDGEALVSGAGEAEAPLPLSPPAGADIPPLLPSDGAAAGVDGTGDGAGFGGKKPICPVAPLNDFVTG